MIGTPGVGNTEQLSEFGVFRSAEADDLEETLKLGSRRGSSKQGFDAREKPRGWKEVFFSEKYSGQL